jgi:hypothetical protein
MPDNGHVTVNGVDGVEHWSTDRTPHTACVRRSEGVARQRTLGHLLQHGSAALAPVSGTDDSALECCVIRCHFL